MAAPGGSQQPPQMSSRLPVQSSDLAQEAAQRSSFLLYDPSWPRWLASSNVLEYTDLTNAFEPGKRERGFGQDVRCQAGREW